MLHKPKEDFHKHMVCRGCQSDTSASVASMKVELDCASFRRIFDHQAKQGARLTDFQRCAIVTLWAVNLSVDQICQMTSCDPRTITDKITKFQEELSLDDMPRSGRPRITEPEQDQAIGDLARSAKFVTPKLINSELELNVSKRTTRRRLNEMGLWGRLARIEHPFTDQNLEQRLQFCTEHESWSDDQWDRVIFGDESYIHLGVHGQIWVQRPVDTAYLKEYMVVGQNQFSPKIGIFACFTSQGVGRARLIDDDMDQRMYTDTMAQVLKPSALAAFPSGGWQYLHDNASYHTGRVSQTWFHNNGIDCIKLPPHSPDLNPIENLFNYWKRRIELRFPRNLEQLRQIALEEWAAIPPINCNVLVASMHDRMVAVIDAEGHKSGY